MSKLEKFMRSGNHDLIVTHLAKIKKPETVVPALGHLDGRVRWGAIQALVRIGTPAIPHLVKALENQELRWSAVQALRIIGNRESLPALEAALKKEKDPWSVGQISSAIVKIKGK
ncbi:MAG TPA: HEAT repeat domain-containing protein [Candidatus Norongarragalinales archaeon]|jgi:HEAT repeat protein|nr:HEAT repeat domain-containing protein [Candidatus Norongarragalinales archaeon]